MKWGQVALCILCNTSRFSNYMEILMNKASQPHSRKYCYPNFMGEGSKDVKNEMPCVTESLAKLETI